MCLRLGGGGGGGFKRFAAVGGSDGVLMGVRIVVRRELKRSVMYAESEELHYAYGYDWNPMPDMELERSEGGGGSYFWKGGSRKGGFGR